MNRDSLLGQLSRQHQMMTELLMSVSAQECYHCYHPELAPLAWYLALSSYLETYWVREVGQGNDEVTCRSREIFFPESKDTSPCWHRLPPRDHLLNWAMELQDGNLMRLANPALLKRDSRMSGNQLLQIILQEHARNYEYMLMVLVQRRLLMTSDYYVSTAAQPIMPKADTVEIPRGHYRIGSRDAVGARDNEAPAQQVELSGFRIASTPVSNGNWLAFIEAGGYQQPDFWQLEGMPPKDGRAAHPNHWRQDLRGNWYGIGLHGPYDLQGADPVMGINRFEAEAYANWVSSQGGNLAGAILQHEYQWEVAVRTGKISNYGLVREWCANVFRPYDGYQPPSRKEESTLEFDGHHFSLRGACLYTQPALKRVSFRTGGRPGAQQLFSGARLVFPPV